MRLLSTLILLGLLAACGGDPINPAEFGIIGEIPPGPGALTGDAGAIERVL